VLLGELRLASHDGSPAQYLVLLGELWFAG
jgi:hypothetical protein